MTIELVTLGGSTRRVVEPYDVQTEPFPGLMIRWGFQNYTLDLRRNQLVYVWGNRITRRHMWKAVDIDEARRVYREMVESKLK